VLRVFRGGGLCLFAPLRETRRFRSFVFEPSRETLFFFKKIAMYYNMGFSSPSGRGKVSALRSGFSAVGSGLSALRCASQRFECAFFGRLNLTACLVADLSAEALEELDCRMTNRADAAKVLSPRTCQCRESGKELSRSQMFRNPIKNS